MRELDIDFTDARAAARVTIVDAQGATVWTGLAIHGRTGTSVRIQPPLREGDYLARVYTSDGTIFHEYGFRIAR